MKIKTKLPRKRDSWHSLAIPVLCIVCVSCGQGPGNSAVGSQSTSRLRPHESSTAGDVAPVAPAIACPSPQFDVFLAHFSNDIGVQKAFTRAPLNVTAYDPQDLEADPVTRAIPKEKVEFPLLHSIAADHDAGVKREVSRKSSSDYRVSTHSTGTGAESKSFDFHFDEGCWHLIGMTDSST